MMAKQQFVTEEYHNKKQLNKGRERMFKRGYQQDSMTTDQRMGCKRRIMGGFFFARPKVFHTVTYQLIPVDEVTDDEVQG